MPDWPKPQLKKIRPYALATIPFLAVFAWELAFVLAHRPETPDILHGYAVPMGSDGKTVYMSVWDCVILFGSWLCGAAVMMTGLWQAGVFGQFVKR